MTIKTKGLLITFLYVMLGLVSYMMIGDFTVFAWIDPWVYIYMALWPLIWAWTFIKWAAIIAVIVIVGIIAHEKWSK